MEYRTFGKSGIKVSRQCFGTMSFGHRADYQMAETMYKLCRERGINFFDCANVYQSGVAEEYLGSFIHAEREKVVITTKAFSPMGADPNQRGSSAKNLRRSLEESLKRLKTDYVDVFFLHGYDDQTGEEEILRTLDVLHKEGKFHCIGVSNYASFQVERLLWTAKLEHLVGISAIQPMYNIAKRMAEVELLPMAEKEGLAVMTYSPLGGGLLTGRYGKGKEGSGRLVENPAYSKRYGGPFYEQVATDFSALAQELGMKEATQAVAWVMAQPRVTCPIIGAANDLQLRDSLSALDVVLSEEVKKKIDTISPPLPPAHDRSEVQQ